MSGIVRISIAASLIATLFGCVRTPNGLQPTLPWNRQVPPAANSANPWAAPGNPATVAPPAETAPQLPTGGLLERGGLLRRDDSRWRYLSDMMQRADQQESLAETQRKQLEALRSLQKEQEDRDRLLAEQQLIKAKEKELLAQQFAEKEKLLKGRMGQLQGRTSDLDANNRDLHAEIARTQQRNDVLQDEIDLLKRRLDENNRMLAQSQQTNQLADQRLKALQASTRRRGNASITANSSITRGITAVMVPGMDIRQEGDLVRIAIPSDRLFMASTAQLHQGSQAYLDQVARVLLEHYPQQMVGIEAHTDHGTTLTQTQWRNQHQLTAAQAMAIFEQMTNRKINGHQMFVLGHGGNHPIVSGGTPEGQAVNRRVEIVVYPETYGS